MKINGLEKAIKDRKFLAEGRIGGMMYAFLSRTGKHSFKPVQALTCCKDFLNDVLYYELYGEILDYIYGFQYEPPIKSIFGNKYAYLVLSFSDDETAANNFSNNYKNVQKLINKIEQDYRLNGRTTITKLRNQSGYYIVEFPLYWVSRFYLLSIFTLMLRMFINPVSDSFKDELYGGDVYYQDEGLVFSLRESVKNNDIFLLYDQDLKGKNQNMVHNSSGVVSFFQKGKENVLSTKLNA